MNKEPFKVGEVVYRSIPGSEEVTRHIIHRVTKTFATIVVGRTDDGVIEEKYRHNDGSRTPHPSAYNYVRIDRETTLLAAKYRRSTSMRLARELEQATRDFLNGTGDPHAITDAYERWSKVHGGDPD